MKVPLERLQAIAADHKEVTVGEGKRMAQELIALRNELEDLRQLRLEEDLSSLDDQR
jgi:hypothetical protein